METPSPDAVLARLVALLPPGRVLVQPSALAAYESDGLTAFRTRPLAVAVAPVCRVARCRSRAAS